VKFLIDQNLSPEVATRLVAAGHDAVHVRERGMQRASDEAVLDAAAHEDRVLVSGDTDFGMLLARSGATQPSFLLFRQRGERRAAQQARLVLENLVELQVELEAGSVVVFTDDRARVRRLPLPPA
jgi:predicted nuclease of predicted toxin-antitoxin system